MSLGIIVDAIMGNIGIGIAIGIAFGMGVAGAWYAYKAGKS
jgi:hypothetical protein